MALDTPAARLACLDFGEVFQSGLPSPSGNAALSNDEIRHMLWMPAWDVAGMDLYVILQNRRHRRHRILEDED